MTRKELVLLIRNVGDFSSSQIVRERFCLRSHDKTGTGINEVFMYDRKSCHYRDSDIYLLT